MAGGVLSSYGISSCNPVVMMMVCAYQVKKNVGRLRHPAQKSRGSIRAYTLPEVIISVAIFATMVGSLFAGFACGFSNIKSTRENLRATQILTGKLEAIRLCTWSQLSNCPASFVEYYDPVGMTNSTQGTVYTGAININAATNIGNGNAVKYKDDIRLVTVSVAWTSSSGRQTLSHSRMVQTFSARNGMQNYTWGQQ